MSVELMKAVSARPTSAARPTAIPWTGPLPSRGSSTTWVPAGRSGRTWPFARTTTTGPPVARATMPTVRRSSVDPCHSSAALGVPIREDRPPASTTPARSATSSWYASALRPSAPSTRGRSHHQPSPGYGDKRAGEVMRLVGYQVPDGFGHIFRRAQSVHRNGVDYGLDDFLGKRGHHVGLDRAGYHAVDGDALGGGLQSERLGQAEEAGLGGGGIG